MIFFRVSLLLSAMLLTAGFTSTPNASGGGSGVFSNSTDIGRTLAGSTVYDGKTREYRLAGGGGDMWGSADAFRFQWVRLRGDATLTAEVRLPPSASIPNEKAVLMFRQSLDPGSPYADIAIHGDGHITSQYRTVSGGETKDDTSAEHNSVRLQITRSGDRYTAAVVGADGRLTPMPTATVALRDPVYVGLGVCSHNADGLLTATFSNVTLTRTDGKPVMP